MLKAWNLSLIIIAFSLTIFGTFLTRSGVLSSIHAFSSGPVGMLFLGFLAVVVLGSFGLLAWRVDRLRGQPELDAVVSRESVFLLNNVVLVAALFAWRVRDFWPLLAVTLSAFVALTILFDTAKAVRARRAIAGERLPAALATLVRRNQRRYGGFIVHLGVVLIILGIAGSMGYSVEREATLQAGETLTIDRFRVRFEGLQASEQPTHRRVEGRFRVWNDEHDLGVLAPALKYFPTQQSPIGRAAIDAFKHALALDGENPEAHAYLGLILLHAGHGDAALLAIERALTKAPNDPLALWAMGLVLFEYKQDYAGAISLWETLMAANLTPANADTLAQWIVTARQRLAAQPAGPREVPTPGGIITGTVALAPSLRTQVPIDGVLFVIARQGDGPPLAVKRIPNPTFPVAFSLGRGDQMLAGTPFEGEVRLLARLKRDGTTGPPAPGDFAGEAQGPVRVGQHGVEIVLDQTY
jgi:tetratricopeptide (TPR) repeat protein